MPKLTKKGTDFGSTNFAKLLHANADSSIHGNFQFDSNVTDESNMELEKHDLRTIQLMQESQFFSKGSLQTQIRQFVAIEGVIQM
jgi:hypothetical protein